MTRRGRFLWEAWYDHACLTPDLEAIVHWSVDAPPVRWTFNRLMVAAQRVAEQLSDAGLRAGDPCGIMLPHHPGMYPIYLGTCLIGAVPCVMARPNSRLHPDKFVAGLRAILRTSGLKWLLTDRAVESTLHELTHDGDSTLAGVLFPLEWYQEAPVGSLDPAFAERHHRNMTPDSAALRQHSSGTTGAQKAVDVSHRQVTEHAQRYGTAIDVRPEDRVVSWLPLYHDMGLIAAFHLPLVWGIPSIQLSPLEWVAAPILWAQAVSDEEGTVSWLPNFAFNHMARRVHDDDVGRLNLASLRLLVNCSEPVRADSFDRFLDRFATAGVRPHVLSTCYAMAEATFAVTQSSPEAPPVMCVVDRVALSEGTVRPTALTDPAGVRCVSSGRVVDGCDLQVASVDSSPLPDNHVGELRVRSVSLCSGYVNQPARTEAAFRDGWYWTGDLGFCRDGEWFIVGRKSDVIIVAGRNIYPEDLEQSVSEIPGVLAGRVVAFGVEDVDLGTEQVCVVAETAVTEQAERARLVEAVTRVGAEVHVAIRQVWLVEPRWLIKSSSGKPSRAENRRRALALPKGGRA